MKSNNRGEPFAMPAEQLCDVDSCQALRVITFADENLCCDHFVSRCYAFLEQLAVNAEMKFGAEAKAGELRKAVSAYSHKVVELCLGSRELSNLQRARLLDILLWAGEISNRSLLQPIVIPHRSGTSGKEEQLLSTVTKEKNLQLTSRLSAPNLH